MKDDGKLTELIERVYDTTTRPHDWVELMVDLAPIFGSTTAQLYAEDFFGPESPFNYNTPVDSACEEV